MCFRHYLLTAYGSGCRPTELCRRYNKRQDVIDRGLTWDDVDIIPQTRWSERLKKEVEDEPIAVLDIRKTKTKVPREVPAGPQSIWNGGKSLSLSGGRRMAIHLLRGQTLSLQTQRPTVLTPTGCIPMRGRRYGQN